MPAYCSTAGVVHNYLFSLGPAIAGGASNTQRNIIRERMSSARTSTTWSSQREQQGASRQQALGL